MTPTIVWTSFIFVIFGKALINKYQKEKNVKIHEGWQGAAQMIAVIGVTILHGIFIADVHTPKNWLPDDYTLAVLIFYPFSWWAFFDFFYNRLIGKEWDFIGSTSGPDKFFRRAGKPAYHMSKAMALILTVICIVIIYTDFA